MFSKSSLWQTLSIAGSVASILAFLSTLPLIGMPTWLTDEPPPSPTMPIFELTGTDLSADVQKALIMLGEQEGVPGNSRHRTVKEAIRQAEQNRGLPTDGMPDDVLLGQLKLDLEKKQVANGGNDMQSHHSDALMAGWGLDDWLKVSQIVTPISAAVLAWLAFFMPRRKGASVADG